MFNNPTPANPALRFAVPSGPVYAGSADSATAAVEGDSYAALPAPFVPGILGSGIGVSGSSGSGIGVQATSQTGVALLATSGGTAVQATTTGGGYGLWASGGQNGSAAKFDGGVEINGKPGTHPALAVSEPGATVTGQLAVYCSGPYGMFIVSGGISQFNGNVQVQGGHYVSGEQQVGGSLTVKGNVNVAGDVLLTGADCAEEFDIATAVEIDCGTVMVLTESGCLQPSREAYDKKVAGVISGAGDCRPGLILDKRHSSKDRLPLALVGKVYCKADAQFGPIEVGDLLTTSPTLGHAMRAADPLKAFGAVIGKALRPLDAGQGLIPILVALQ